MYKNILFVSDNLEMSRFIFRYIKKYFSSLNTSFSISPFSDIKIFSKLIDTSFEVFDMKNGKDIDQIINRFDLVFSIHCKQIFPSKLVHSVKCINLHPGYNPINRGWYPQVFAIINGLDCGATLHEIDEKLDHGKIIDRQIVKQKIYDTSLSLYKKVQKAELVIFKKNFKNIIKNKYTAFKPEEEGNIFYLSDFKKLTEIKLTDNILTADLINKLRALSHGDFKNAYFHEPVTNKRVFIKLELYFEK